MQAVFFFFFGYFLENDNTSFNTIALRMAKTRSECNRVKGSTVCMIVLTVHKIIPNTEFFVKYFHYLKHKNSSFTEECVIIVGTTKILLIS